MESFKAAIGSHLCHRLPLYNLAQLHRLATTVSAVELQNSVVAYGATWWEQLWTKDEPLGFSPALLLQILHHEHLNVRSERGLLRRVTQFLAFQNCDTQQTKAALGAVRFALMTPPELRACMADCHASMATLAAATREHICQLASKALAHKSLPATVRERQKTSSAR